MPFTATTARTARQLTIAAVCAASGLSALAVPGAHAAQPARADLTVSAGAVRSLDGDLGGKFTVRNLGSRAAGRSSAALRIRSGSGVTRTVARFSVSGIGPRLSRSVRVDGFTRLSSGTLIVCADSLGQVRERSELNNCRTVGTLRRAAGGTTTPTKPVPTPGPGPVTPAPTTTPAPPASTPGSSVPTAPAVVKKETIVMPSTASVPYWAYVSSSYDASHKTPTSLFVWMHGCGGDAQGDVNVIAPYSGEDYLAISVGGRDGQCWDMNTDPAKVTEAIADVKKHFNIDPKRVVLGGYSSGGDLAYRTAYENSTKIAGVLAENSSPFRDTGLTEAAALAKATAKFHVVHLAHLQDDTYPIAGVRSETDALKNAGFPVTRIERAGTHYDDSTATTGTDRDVQTQLLPHLADGWTSAG